MLLRDRKRWRIKQIDELDDGKLDEQKCTQKIGILPGTMKKWQIKRIDELDDDELDEFYGTFLLISMIIFKRVKDKFLPLADFFRWPDQLVTLVLEDVLK